MKKQHHDYLKFKFQESYRKNLVKFAIIAIGTIALVCVLFKSNLLAFKSESPEIEIVDLPVENDDFDKIENGIHVRTGFVDAPGMMVTIQNCTNCHSSKLVIQNRMNVERWKTTIKWMQETQNLWDLGDNQEVIINYLVTNYPPKRKGRREALTNIEWYELEE